MGGWWVEGIKVCCLSYIFGQCSPPMDSQHAHALHTLQPGYDGPGLSVLWVGMGKMRRPASQATFSDSALLRWIVITLTFYTETWVCMMDPHFEGPVDHPPTHDR